MIKFKLLGSPSCSDKIHPPFNSSRAKATESSASAAENSDVSASNSRELEELASLFREAGNPQFNTEEMLLFSILTGQHDLLSRRISRITGQELPSSACSTEQFHKVVTYIKSRYVGQLPDFPFEGSMCKLNSFGWAPGDHPCIKVAGREQVGFRTHYVVRSAPQITAPSDLNYFTLKSLLRAESDQEIATLKQANTQLKTAFIEIQQEIRESLENLRHMLKEKRAL